MVSLTYIIGFMAIVGVAVYISYKKGHAVPSTSVLRFQHLGESALQAAVLVRACITQGLTQAGCAVLTQVTVSYVGKARESVRHYMDRGNPDVGSGEYESL